MSVAQALTKARLAASDDPTKPLSFRRVRDRVLPLLGDYTPTEETIRSMHHEDRCPPHPDPVVLAALARVYGVKLGELSTEAEMLLRAVRSRCDFPGARRARPHDGTAVAA
jgi:hypothetical protein